MREIVAFVVIIVLFVIALVLPAVVLANTFNYRIVEVIDGDTVKFEAPFLPQVLGTTLNLRIEGIDTPESNYLAKCNAEKQLGIAAAKYTYATITNSSNNLIVLTKWDKYGGRVLGDVVVEGKRLSTLLVEKGYAVQYDGGTKPSWCH